MPVLFQERERMNFSIVPRRTALITSAVMCGLLVIIVACGSSSNSVPARTTLSTVIFTGDSLTAGYQNGSLWQKQQPNGYAALIAKQAKLYFILPLVADPGIPAALELVSVSPLDVQPMSGTSTGRVNMLMQPTVLAVPGHMLTDLINYQPVIPPVTGEDIITDVVLAFPPGNTGSQLNQAIAANPTTLFVWIGNNDALVADFAGTPAAMTSTADFTTQFTTLMSTLKSKTSAHLIVANIPDVTMVPYLTPAALIIGEVAAATGQSTATISAALGIVPGDYVNATGLGEVKAMLGASTLNPLTADAVLTAAEATQVQAQVDAYNAVIASQVASAGGILVDIHSLFAAMAGGVPINGYTATNAFLGGLFSLDGIHPTNTGYAIVANAFIDTMNANLSTTVPDVDVSAVAAADPLFPPNIVPVGAESHSAGWRSPGRSIAAS
jgi:phospholipase/lecithinase/hemolysin